MDSLEDEGVVVKSPSFDSSDEEVTVRKKIVVIESDGDERKWMRNRRTMQDKARRGRGTSPSWPRWRKSGPSPSRWCGRQRSGCRTTDRDRGPWRIFSTRWWRNTRNTAARRMRGASPSRPRCRRSGPSPSGWCRRQRSGCCTNTATADAGGVSQLQEGRAGECHPAQDGTTGDCLTGRC